MEAMQVANVEPRSLLAAIKDSGVGGTEAEGGDDDERSDGGGEDFGMFGQGEKVEKSKPHAPSTWDKSTITSSL
jgi:hypothetical protein